jgi:tetratricopeptide (TPR) repeat protein
VLEQLRAEPGGEFGAATLATELLAARGDYDAALRVAFPELPSAAAQAAAEARHATDSARAAKLLMLVAEKDPSLAAKAVPLAQRHIAAMARNSLAAQADRTGRALFALQTGDLPAAQRESRICLARARTPLALADALCTQARIEAQRGRVEKVVKRLDEAEKFAPWYPRVATVRQLVSAGTAAAVPQPLIVSAETDTAHVFAEPWSVAAPASDEG